MVTAKQRYTEPRPICNEGPKDLGGNRMSAADLNWTRGCSIPYDIEQKKFCRGGSAFGSLLLLRGIAGHWLGGGEKLRMQC